MYKKGVFILLLFFAQLSSAQDDSLDASSVDIDSLIEAVSDDNYDPEHYENDYENETVESTDTIPAWDLREVDKVKWQKIKKDKRFIYKKIKKKKKEKKKKKRKGFDGSFLNSGIIKLFLYILFGAFLVYIIYLFIKNNDLSFKKNIKDKEVVQEEPWENVQSFEEWELALQKALQEKDYRLATRIYYLHTLNILDKNGHVLYKEDKTNWYFVQKLFGGPLHDDFMELTKSFDYIWYGEYQITEAQFAQLQSQFKEFHYKIA